MKANLCLKVVVAAEHLFQPLEQMFALFITRICPFRPRTTILTQVAVVLKGAVAHPMLNGTNTLLLFLSYFPAYHGWIRIGIINT